MRQVARKGLISVAAAGGVLAMSGASAFADAGADGAATNSPGVASGNTVQVPVHVPVNICGNTVNVVGLLNPAAGNACMNGASGGGQGGGSGGSESGGGSGHGDAGGNGGSGAQADGAAQGSPGVASGNQVQVPVDVPVNVCGNSVDVVGVGNPALGNECANNTAPQPEQPEDPGSPEQPEDPGYPEEPENPGNSGGDYGKDPMTSQKGVGEAAPEENDGPRVTGAQVSEPQLAQTGGSPAMSAALPMGAGLLIGGVVLYQRGRLARQR